MSYFRGKGWQVGATGTQAYLMMGLVLIVLGLLVQSNIMESILDIIGYILIVMGIVALIFALISLLPGLRKPRL